MILQDSRLSTLGPVVSGCQVCTFPLDKKDVPKPNEMKSLLKIIHLLKEKHRKWSGTQPDICLVSQDGSTVFTQRLTKSHDYQFCQYVGQVSSPHALTPYSQPARRVRRSHFLNLIFFLYI